MYKFLKTLVLLFAVVAGSIITLQKVTNQPQTATGNRPAEVSRPQRPAQPELPQWAPDNLKRHWAKHRAEFPEFRSEQEYGNFALKFFREPPPGTLRKTRGKNGDKLYYHPESNVFGATTAGGIPKTLFRPDKGIRYWKRQ